ncbi:hypothetical protein VTL71DRAFT_1900 [Oculimacula yallundae]|uniref:Extracellular serine-rich protein n=1 Tax=Oculimacula yallundae TaxID=86028 RepID=A0ABR4CC14_9HELO
MFSPCMRACILVGVLCLPSAYGHHHHHRSTQDQTADSSETITGLNSQSLAIVVPPVALVLVNNDDLSIKTNTTVALPVDSTAESVTGDTIDSTALVIARDLASAYSAYSSLNDRGIPYSILVVPQTGESLPSLNDTATHGNFGLIVIMSEVSYNYGDNLFKSALTPAQWQQLYNYQVAFGVRMVRLDVAPSTTTGTQSLGSCCGNGIQLVSITNSTSFPGAGLKVGAGVTTKGLYHYPAKIIDPSIAVEIAQFSASAEDGFNSTSTAAVINNIDGRQQMVFFLPFNVQWSLASNLLQHAWVHWATRGLYVGYRRATLSTQVDDMFLQTPMFDSGENFRVSGSDMAHHVTVMKDVNKRLPAGSKWVIEIAHNGNGNIEAADPEYAERDSIRSADSVCSPGPIDYAEQFDTPLEYQKPLGSGTDLWPETATDYANYSSKCMKQDDLLTWWQKSSNLNAFSHVSHTFTHEDQNNATYQDVSREISWNKGWLDAVGISAAKQFSSTGIIPPAITGLHNGDALQAWADNGIIHVVGDNTRKALLNPTNEHWPFTSTLELNGFAGIQISPRWASNIYYNCNYADCVLAEWKAVSNGTGDMYQLLDIERETNVRHLLGLHHDPFMFHQANMMFEDADTYDFGGDITVMSLLEVWVDVVTREYTRLVTWPLVSQKHDDVAAGFRARMTRDNCKPTLTWKVDSKINAITAVTVSANRNTCSAPIPVTFPGTVTDQQGATAEQLGGDPLTLWVSLTGKPVSFTLTKPVSL